MQTTTAQPDVLDLTCGSRRALERLADALCHWAEAHLAEADAHRAAGRGA